MNKKQIREKYSKGNIAVDINQLYHLKEQNFKEESTIDGKLYTGTYMLKSTIIDDLNQLCMGFLDNYWPYDNEEKFKIKPDKDTLEFISALIDDMAGYALDKVKTDPYLDTEDVEYEIPIFLEISLWRIYIILNEINKYVYDVPLFDFAEEIINSTDEDDKWFIKEFCNLDINYLKRTAWVLFDKIEDKEPVVTILQ